MQAYQQKNWFLTYNAVVEIGPWLFSEEGLIVDQAVSTKDNALNYVFFHLLRKVRLPRIEKFVASIGLKYGIRINEIFGFKAIECSSRGNRIHKHPGFRTLVMHDLQNHDNFKLWTAYNAYEKPQQAGYFSLRRLAREEQASYVSNGDDPTEENHQRATGSFSPQRLAREERASRVPDRDGHINENHEASAEFDVVKKRRAMDAAPGEESCPLALSTFEEFEANVLTALLEVSCAYQKNRFEDLLETEKDYSEGVLPPSGHVYVAVSKAVQYPKIGATRRGDPNYRIKELSRHVPSPFNLVYSVSTPTPFRSENEIHKHFDAFRIKEKGACTEFFSVDLETIEKFLQENYAGFKKH